MMPRLRSSVVCALALVPLLPLVAQAATTQHTKLTASDGEANDYFGRSVSISGDWAVVGAPNHDAAGAAYVLSRSGTTWTEQAKLTASDGAANDFFGFSVVISGDTVVVGAVGDDDNGSNSGSAYVFTRGGTTWTEQAKLTAGDGAADDWLGRSVSIGGDTAVVGAFSDTVVDWSAAYVFTRSGTTWTEQAKLTASDGASYDHFGRSVSIDGDTVVVGAPVHNLKGAAYVYARSGTTWTEQSKLTAGDGATSDWFGASVSIDCDTAVVGASRHDYNGTDSGAAYVFTRSGTTWAEQAKLTASDGATYDLFGASVSIDGDTTLVGAYGDYENGPDSGTAFAFARSGSTWVEGAKLTAGDGAAGDLFGASVSISGDTAVVGAYGDDDNGAKSGSVHVFELDLAVGMPGDCNGDLAVNVSDLTAVVLEIFDGDGSAAANAPGGTYPGMLYCDSNEDGVINVSDLTCVVLLIFNGPGACG